MAVSLKERRRRAQAIIISLKFANVTFPLYVKVDEIFIHIGIHKLRKMMKISSFCRVIYHTLDHVNVCAL